MKKKLIILTIGLVVVLGVSSFIFRDEIGNGFESVKSFLGISSNKNHSAAGEIDFNDLLEDVEANAVSEQKIVNCLKDKGVTFYGGGACGFSKEDVEESGKKMKQFAFVDCDKDQTLCEIAGITDSIPVWAANGKQAKNITSLNDLVVEFGCDEG